MIYRPDSLEEALKLRKQHPGILLSFSETGGQDDAILLSALAEIDLCFEDHGHIIFGLNLPWKELLEFIDERDNELRQHLEILSPHSKEDTLVGEIIINCRFPGLVLQTFTDCKAAIKTYNGNSGRVIPFSGLNKGQQMLVFQKDELPLLILIPKEL